MMKITPSIAGLILGFVAVLIAGITASIKFIYLALSKGLTLDGVLAVIIALLCFGTVLIAYDFIHDVAVSG